MTNRQIISNTLPNAFPLNANWVLQPQQNLNKIVVPKEPFKAKKAGTKGNHCFLILDESGSMSSITKDTIGGINTFIEKQKEDKDNTRLTIVKFEGGNINVPLENVDVQEIKNFKDYSPKGGTNLLDAVGFTLNKINSLLKGMKKAERPSIFVQIVTDGEENSSKTYIKEEIQGMIGQVTNADWIVTYVGANVDSFHEATSLGIHSSAVSNYKTSNIGDTFTAMASSTSRMKSLRSVGTTAMNMYDSNVVYTAEEKDKMEK